MGRNVFPSKIVVKYIKWRRIMSGLEIEKNLQGLEGNEFENEEDDADEKIDDNRLTAYDIAVFYNTYNLSTLMKWWGGKLIVPDFQRAYVWSLQQASEFVDSILRGLPVPSIFFYDDRDNSRYLVVDGQQRLNSLYAYIRDQKYAGKKFRLKGNIHPNWVGKSYEELEDEDKDRLEETLMNITLMRQLMPDEGQSAMYLAFQRINTGGRSLKAQEIRMAVSYGPLAKYIDELSRDQRFDKWDFLRTKSQRMNDDYSPIQEFLVKFFAYYFSYPDKFSGKSTRSFLDDFFAQQKEFDKPKREKQGVTYFSKQEFEKAFEAAFDIMISLDIKILAPYEKPTQTFLEAIWVGLTYRKLQVRKDVDIAKLESHIKEWKEKIGKDKFSELFQARRTSSLKSAKERIEEGIRYFEGEI